MLKGLRQIINNDSPRTMQNLSIGPQMDAERVFACVDLSDLKLYCKKHKSQSREIVIGDHSAIVEFKGNKVTIKDINYID